MKPLRVFAWVACAALATLSAAAIAQVPKAGVVSWQALAQVAPVKQQDRIVPQFSNELTELDRKEVRLQGFMLPLETGPRQKRFLLSAVPPECAYCLPGGAEQLVEVQAKVPVKYVLDPIVVSGKFILLREDAGGLLYRLVEAALVEK